MKFIRKLGQAGFISPALLSFMIAMIILTSAAITLIDSNIGLVGNNIKSQRAFNIAEAGINYYLWHLSHDATDYQDGQSTPATPDPELGYGPYVHDYVDDNAKVAGTYTLWIKPQGNGSTIVNIRSIGKVNGSNITRTVEAQIGAPSFASYVLAIDGPVAFGSTSTAGGPVHSNVGVQMDAPNYGDVTSANTTYNVGGVSRPGVWCSSGSPDCANRTATNSGGTWRFPVPSIDFNAVTGGLCDIKKDAFEAVGSTASLASLPNACNQLPSSRTAAYVPRLQTTYNSRRGYLIELNTNGTYNLYSVTNETYNYTNNNNYTYQWQTALSETLVQSNITIPSANVIFVEDNVWVRTNPTYHGRVTIAAGRLTSTGPSTNANIVIADDIKYSTKNGQDAIGLVAQQNVWLAPYAPPRPSDAASNYPFEIDAAIIAKEGNFGIQSTYLGADFPEWNDSAKQLYYYGSIAVKGTAGWRIEGGSNDDGFGHRQNDYDNNLLYAPPPSFPITSTYNILSWREVLTRP